MGKCLFMRKGEVHSAPVGLPALSTLATGSAIKLNVNGVATEFLVIHSGKPSTLYDSSCDGVWLVMKDAYEARRWDGTTTSDVVNNYKASDIHSYLNGTFLNLFDADIKTAIKQIKIPYVNGTGTSGSIASGSSGLSTKVFLLSGYEVGLTTSNNSYIPVDGAKLDYFKTGTASAAQDLRESGNSKRYWLRSPYMNSSASVWRIDSDGAFSNYSGVNPDTWMRPALILPKTLLVNTDGTIKVA